MNKDEIINKFLDLDYAQNNYKSKQYKPRPVKKLGLPIDLKYGVEFEFPFNAESEDELLYNFYLYNKRELNQKWELIRNQVFYTLVVY